MYPGFRCDLSNGGSNNWITAGSCFTRCAYNASSACFDRAASHQRQPVLAEAQAVLDRANAVFVDGAGFIRARGQVVIALLIRLDGAAVEELCPLVEHPCITQRRDVPAGGEREPEVIVGDA